MTGVQTCAFRSSDLATALGREGAARVRERYTWDRTVASFEEVYDEVLGLASFAPEGARERRGASMRERR